MVIITGTGKKESIEWDTGLNIITDPEITLDSNLLFICDSIQKKLPGTEFSILCKGFYSDTGFHITDDYVIPQQEVSTCSIEYGDVTEYQKQGYNVVIHSHHNLGSFFSQTDEEYINTHFLCSVLYTVYGFTLGTLTFRGDDSIFQLKVGSEDIKLLHDTIPIVGFENIEKKAYTYYPPKKLNKKGIIGIINKDVIDYYGEEEEEDTKYRECGSCNYFKTDYCLNCYAYHDFTGNLTEEEYDKLSEKEQDEYWEKLIEKYEEEGR